MMNEDRPVIRLTRPLYLKDERNVERAVRSRGHLGRLRLVFVPLLCASHAPEMTAIDLTYLSKAHSLDGRILAWMSAPIAKGA